MTALLFIFVDSQSEWAGDKYVGEYRDNKMNGQGAYFFADGSRALVPAKIVNCMAMLSAIMLMAQF